MARPDMPKSHLSLSLRLFRELEQVARQEGCSKSAVYREALRLYVQEHRWRGLQRYGARRTRQLGMTEADAQRAGREFRRGR